MKNLKNFKVQYAWTRPLLFLLFLLYAAPSIYANSKKLDIYTETTKSSEVLFVKSDTSLLDLIMQNYREQIACLEQSWNACYFESFTSYCTKRYDWLLSKKSREIGEYFLDLNKLIPKASTFIDLQDGLDINKLRFSDEEAQQILNRSLEFFKFYFDKGLYNYDNQDSIRLVDRIFTDDGILISEDKRHDSFTPSFSKRFEDNGGLEEFYWTFPLADGSNNSNCTFEYKKIYNSTSDEKDEIIQKLNLYPYVNLSYRLYGDGSQKLSIDWMDAFDLDITLENGKLKYQELQLYEGCSKMNLEIVYNYPLNSEVIFNNGIMECTYYGDKTFYDFNKMEYGSVRFNEKGDTTYLDLTRFTNKSIENEDGLTEFKIHFDCEPHVEFQGDYQKVELTKVWSEDWDVDSGKKVFYLSEEEIRDSDKGVFLKTRYWPNGEVKSKSRY